MEIGNAFVLTFLSCHSHISEMTYLCRRVDRKTTTQSMNHWHS